MKNNEHDAGKIIGAKAFFESTGRSSFLNETEIEYSKFEDKETGLLKIDIPVKKRNCPVCENENYRIAFYKYGFNHRICEECGMLYVSPILEEKYLEKFYRESKIYDGVYKVMISESQRKFDEIKFNIGLNLIEKHLDKNQKRHLLDIGCFAGHFIEVAQEKKWDCIGMELNVNGTEACKSKGINIMETKLEDNTFNEKSFSLVTLWDVLEHLDEPKSIINTIHKILGDKGLLLILVPNGSSLAARILQEKCNMFNGCQHINLFSPETLSRLLENTGYIILEKQSIISEFSVLTNYLNYQHPYFGKGDKVNNFFGLINEDDLHAKMLGYKVMMLAQKK